MMDQDLINKKLEMIEQSRLYMHRLVDAQYDGFIEKLNGNFDLNTEKPLVIRMSLATESAFFKGKKPVEVEFSDGNIIATPTWREAAAAILMDCNNIPKMHYSLIRLAGKVYGRDRILLSDSEDNMIAPIKIDEGLYFEGKFDTEGLLNVMKKRLFDVIGYDYSDINIKITDRNTPVQAIEQTDDGEIVMTL